MNASHRHTLRGQVERLEARDVPAAFARLNDTLLGPTEQTDFVTGDFDGDGKADAAVVSRSFPAPILTILRGNGDGTFTEQQSFNLPAAPDPVGAVSSLPGAAFPDTLLVAKLDGDNRPDIVVTMTSFFSGGFARGQVLTLRNTGTAVGTVSFAAPVSISPRATNGIAAATFAGANPNALDLVAIDDNTDGYTVFRNDGIGNFTPTANAAGFDAGYPLLAADFDGDTKNDFAGRVGGNYVLAYGKGDGTFETPVAVAVAGSFSHLAVGDFNADGKNDLATLDSLNVARLLINTKVGSARTYATAVSFYTENQTSGSGGANFATGDFNLDGRADVVVLSSSGKNSVFYGAADGTVTADADNPYPIGASYRFTFSSSRIAIDDLDGDRNPDVIEYSPLQIVSAPRAIGPPFVSRITPFANLAPDPTVVTTAPTTTTFGDSVVLTATVAPLVPPVPFVTPSPPSGTVTFTLNGVTFLGTLAGGTATVTVPTDPNLPPASYVVTARYDGSTVYRPSPVVTTTAAVVPAPTITTITATPSSLMFGDFTQILIRVKDADGLPITVGTVDVFINGARYVTAGLDANGETTFGTNNFIIGTNVLDAVYSGELRFASSIAETAVTVTARDTSSGIRADGTVVFGTSYAVQFFFRQSLGPVSPTGNYQLFEDGTLIDTVPVDARGNGVSRSLTRPVGVYSYRSEYVSGDSNYASNTTTPNPLVIAVVPAPTTTTIAASPAGGSVFGDLVVLSAAVGRDPALPVPTGLLSFFQDELPIGVVTVGVDGTATLPGFRPAFGPHLYTVSYSGETRFRSSASEPLFYPVNPAPTKTNLVAAPNPTERDATVTLLATVFGPGTTPSPTGFVEFFNGTTSLGRVVVAADGTATLPTTFPAGTFALRAVYLGEARYLVSESATVTEVVNRRALGLTLASAPNPSAFTKAVTLTATLVPPAGFALPQGTIEFFAGTESLGTGTIDANGTATVVTTRLPVGTTALTATYAGSEGYLPVRSNIVLQAVTAIATRITLAVVPPTEFVGRTVELIAVVSIPSLGRALVTGPVRFTNSVRFLRGTEVLGTVPVAADGTARLTTTTLPIGPSDIVAQYEGDVNYAAAASLPARAFINDLPTIAVGSDSGAVVCVFDNLTKLRHGITDFGPEFAGVRPVTADLTGDGVAEIIAGNGAGSPNRFTVIDGATKRAIFTTQPFEDAYTGGIFIAVGDVDGDGRADIVVAPDAGGGSRVQVYRNAPKDFVKIADVIAFPEDEGYRGGLRLAVGDVNGDQFADVILSAGDGGGPRVAGLSGRALAGNRSARVFSDFFAFESGLRIGAYVAVTDFNGDGFADVIVGAGIGGAPRVSVFNGDLLGNGNRPSILADFFAGDPARRGGIRVAGRDLDLDGRGDLITGAGRGDGSTVNVFLAKLLDASSQPKPNYTLEAFPTLQSGVYVG